MVVFFGLVSVKLDQTTKYGCEQNETLTGAFEMFQNNQEFQLFFDDEKSKNDDSESKESSKDTPNSFKIEDLIDFKIKKSTMTDNVDADIDDEFDCNAPDEGEGFVFQKNIGSAKTDNREKVNFGENPDLGIIFVMGRIDNVSQCITYAGRTAVRQGTGCEIAPNIAVTCAHNIKTNKWGRNVCEFYTTLTLCCLFSADFYCGIAWLVLSTSLQS